MASIDTVINEVNASQDLARSLAQSSITATTSLVAKAIDTLEGYTPQFPQDAISFGEPVGADFGDGSFAPEEKPPQFPAIREAQAVDMGALGDIDTLDATFSGERPTLNLPDFAYPTVAPLEGFSQSAPVIDTSFTVPDAPEITDPDEPELLALRTDISTPDIALPPVSITLPTRPRYALTNEFAALFAAGKTAAPDPYSDAISLTEQCFPRWKQLTDTVSAHIEAIVAGTAKSLPDDTDSALYNALLTRVEAERDQALAQLDEQTTATGWAMVGQARAAGQRRIQQKASQDLRAASLEAYIKSAEWTLQYRQAVLGMAQPLYQSAITLFGTAAGLSFQAFDAALKYAQVAMGFVIEVYRTLQRDYEIDQMFVDKQIAIIHEERAGELAKLQVTDAELKVESLKSEQNRERLEQLRLQIEIGAQRLTRYDRQLDTLDKTLKARRLPLEAFLASVEGYRAAWQAKAGEYAQVEAIIRGHEGKTRSELAKLDVYKTDAEVFNIETSAKAKKIDGQIQRNQQVLREFEIRQTAEVQLTEIDAKVAAHALDAYKSMAAIFIAESQERLEKAKLEFQQEVEKAALEIKNREFEFNRQYKNLEIEITRVKATADMQMAAAQVQSHVGASAMSAVNTMAQLSANLTS